MPTYNPAIPTLDTSFGQEPSALSSKARHTRTLPRLARLLALAGFLAGLGGLCAWLLDLGPGVMMLCVAVLAGVAWVSAATLSRTERALTAIAADNAQLYAALQRDLEMQKSAYLASQRMAAIVENSDDAIISKDLNGIIMSWNRGAERIFGYKADEVIGKPINILIPADHQDEEPGILARLRKGEPIDHYETVRQRKDGTLLNISLTVSPVRDDTGRIVGAAKIARDVTEKKRVEREVREARDQLAEANQNLERRVAERTASLQQAIGQMEEFSYTVSHDLRAPVRAMQGYAQATLEDYGGTLDERGRDYLSRIFRGASRMQRLIDDVLVYSRLARSEIQLKRVSLDNLIREVIQQFPEMQPPKAQITIRAPLLHVTAHESSLSQAISNLLSNAVKFVRPDTTPRVQLWTESRDGRVRLWVADNGIGIKPQYHHRLFGLFERVHPEHQYAGTGIGLAIVRKSVEKMGGQTGVESDGVSGSRFWIELPAA